MIQTLKNGDGYIYAYIEYTVLDEDSNFKNGGEYGFIRRAWIHEDHRNNGSMGKLIRKIDEDPEFKNVKWLYWLHEKRNDRRTPMYKRDSLKKLGERYAQV